MTNILNLPYPPRWLNAFVFDTLAKYEDVGVSLNQKIVPIFSDSHVSMEDTYKKLIQSSGIENPLLIQYERLLRLRTTPFYPQKKEQLFYQIYSTSLSHVNNASIVIAELLDREDSSAQDINSWCAKNPQTNSGAVLPYNVYFHRTRVFQIDEAQQIYKPISNNPFFYRKIIIECEYHSNHSHYL